MNDMGWNGMDCIEWTKIESKNGMEELTEWNQLESTHWLTN